MIEIYDTPNDFSPESTEQPQEKGGEVLISSQEYHRLLAIEKRFAPILKTKTRHREEYVQAIKRALRGTGANAPALEMEIQALASARRSLDMANAEIDTLERTTIQEATRMGMKLAPHPAFKVQKEALAAVKEHTKVLGLTADALDVGEQDDPLVDLTKKVINAGRKAAK